MWPSGLPAVLQLRGYGQNFQHESGSTQLCHYWGHLDTKASRQYYMSIFLGCWPDTAAI